MAPIGQKTAEMLALKFPHSHHLIPEMEETCEKIEKEGRGWGRILIDSHGLNRYGRVLIRFFDVQCRRFLPQDQ